MCLEMAAYKAPSGSKISRNRPLALIKIPASKK
jgi:hypothetical protein